MNEPRPYLDFYGQHNIAPVRQDISDLDQHLRRRAALYSLLHVPVNAVRGRRVLEIGPGSGHNAIYTASLGPAFYTLMDGNPRSLAECRARLLDPALPFSMAGKMEIVEQDFTEFRGADKFDLVICEGLIHGQLDPEGFTRRAASLVDDGGMLIITANGATAIVSEVCRRLIKTVLQSRLSDDKLLPALCAIFDAHLSTIPGRSRLTEDWVWDNILHPWPDALPFSASRAIRSVMPGMEFFGSSPSVAQDFRWYKAIPLGRSITEMALQQVEQWAPLFIDYRLDQDTRLSIDGDALETQCFDFYMLAQRAWESGNFEKVVACLECVEGIGGVISRDLPATAQAISDFIAGLRGMIEGDRTERFGTFPPWFGRGMQYLSFARR